MFAGCEPSIVRQVTEYGEMAGVAFQLADDVIDLRSDGATTGKTPGTDLREGVSTMPVLALRARVVAGGDPADAALLARIEGDLSDDAVLADVVAELGKHPVVDETAALARRWSEQAAGAIGRLPGGQVRDALEAFAQALVARAS
jgi:heptaprenyl diphosphate synthase